MLSFVIDSDGHNHEPSLMQSYAKIIIYANYDIIKSLLLLSFTQNKRRTLTSTPHSLGFDNQLRGIDCMRLTSICLQMNNPTH